MTGLESVGWHVPSVTGQNRGGGIQSKSCRICLHEHVDMGMVSPNVAGEWPDGSLKESFLQQEQSVEWDLSNPVTGLFGGLHGRYAP